MFVSAEKHPKEKVLKAHSKAAKKLHPVQSSSPFHRETLRSGLMSALQLFFFYFLFFITNSK